MPKFKVTTRRDAWVNYESTVEAPDAEAARRQVEDAWNTGSAKVAFEEVGLSTFDSATVELEDVEPVDE